MKIKSIFVTGQFLPWHNIPQWAKTSSLSRNHVHTHLDTPHSVGLLWASDQPDAEISTWRHTTLRRERHPCPRRDSKPRYQQVKGRRSTP